MKTITTILFVLISSLSLSQTNYNKAMENALTNWKNAESLEEMTTVAHQFDRISEKDSTHWEPRYYSILIRTIQGFSLPKSTAIAAMDDVEADYESLIALEDNSEVNVLKGLYQTVKISKDPMVYGRTLSASVMQSYQEALAKDPYNPRALFHLAQFEMGAAKFWGKDPQDSCPKIAKSIELFEAENEITRKSFEPRWGIDQAQDAWTKVCE